jgi:hypothetical protein
MQSTGAQNNHAVVMPVYKEASKESSIENGNEGKEEEKGAKEIVSPREDEVNANI